MLLMVLFTLWQNNHQMSLAIPYGGAPISDEGKY